jgi:hypothetical protein
VKGAASLLLRLVDDLTRVAHLHQTGQAERTTSYVLDQTLDTRWKEHRLVHTEAAVFPAPHALDDFLLDLLLGQVQLEDRSPLLVAGWTRAPLLAREGDEHLMVTVGTANSGKAFLQIPALEKGCHRLLDDRPPETVLALKLLLATPGCKPLGTIP